MKLGDCIAGLQTLQPYYAKGGDAYCLGAEHDEFYAYATERPLSDADVQKMINLGWHQEYSGRDYSRRFSVQDYRVKEGWVAYV